MLLLAAALLLKALLPAGFMPQFGAQGLRVVLCAAAGGEQRLLIALPGKPAAPQGAPDHAPDHKAGGCAFDGLTAPLIGGADALLLIGAIAFICAAARRALLVPPRAPAQLRPPLRGPPLAC